MKSLETDKIESFSRLVTAGIDAWVEAGKLLNEIIAENPNARQEIQDKNPWMTYAVIDGFERIGRKEIYPHLLLDRSIGAKKLISLPYEDQRRLFGGEVQVAVMRRGEIVVEPRKIQDLSPKEANLAFDDSCLRPLSEQRQMLRPKVSMRSVCRTTEVKEEEESEIPESLEDEPPKDEDIEVHLSAAQARLIKAREAMSRKEVPPALDRFITSALSAIGNLRFELKELK